MIASTEPFRPVGVCRRGGLQEPCMSTCACEDAQHGKSLAEESATAELSAQPGLQLRFCSSNTANMATWVLIYVKAAWRYPGFAKGWYVHSCHCSIAMPCAHRSTGFRHNMDLINITLRIPSKVGGCPPHRKEKAWQAAAEHGVRIFRCAFVVPSG